MRVSCSSCKLEIHATNECCKLTQGLRLIMDDLGLPESSPPRKTSTTITAVLTGQRAGPIA
jgi:hypothetical protein